MANSLRFSCKGRVGFIDWLDDLESTALRFADDTPSAVVLPKMKRVACGISESRACVNFNVVRRLNADQAHAMIDSGNRVDEADDLICFALRQITATIIELICDQLPKRRRLGCPR